MEGSPGPRAARGQECRVFHQLDGPIQCFLGLEGIAAPKGHVAAFVYWRRDRIALSVPLNGLLGREQT